MKFIEYYPCSGDVTILGRWTMFENTFHIIILTSITFAIFFWTLWLMNKRRKEENN